MTAESYSVPDVRLLHHAYAGASGGCSTACVTVHLSVPKDVQTGESRSSRRPSVTTSARAGRSMRRRRRGVRSRGGGPPRRIVLLAGFGRRRRGGGASLVELAERFQLPVATTQLAKGGTSEDHELSLGVSGYAGCNRATTAFLDGRADLVVALGSAFNQRQSLHWTDRLGPEVRHGAVDTSAVPVTVASTAVRFVHGHPAAMVRWWAPTRRPRSCSPTGSTSDGLARPIQELFRYLDLDNTTSDQVPIHPARMCGRPAGRCHGTRRHR